MFGLEEAAGDCLYLGNDTAAEAGTVVDEELTDHLALLVGSYHEN